MAGALNAVADDYPDDDQDPGYVEPVDSPGTGSEPPPSGPLSHYDNPYAKRLYDTGERLIGSPDDPNGALSRYQGIPGERGRAEQEKYAAIQRAYNLILHAGQNRNLAPLAGMAAFGTAPHVSGNDFGTSAGFYNKGYFDEISKQRDIERDMAGQLGNLELQRGNIPSQTLTAQAGDLEKVLNMGREFETSAAGTQSKEDAAELAYRRAVDTAGLNVAGRRDVAGINADSRENVANTGAASRESVANTNVAGRSNVAQITADARRYAADAFAKSRIDVADIQAARGQIKYIGNLPDDPNTGIYLNQNNGDVTHGPGVQGASAQRVPADILKAEYLVSHGIAPDLSSAWGMVRAGVNDSREWQLRVQAEKKLLAALPQYAGADPADLEKAAREVVAARASQRPGLPPPGGPAPRPGSPAAAPAGPAAPPPFLTLPPKPAGVPDGARYSPSQKNWWWQQNGQWAHN